MLVSLDIKALKRDTLNDSNSATITFSSLNIDKDQTPKFIKDMEKIEVTSIDAENSRTSS